MNSRSTFSLHPRTAGSLLVLFLIGHSFHLAAEELGADDARIHYSTSGPREAPVMIFLHDGLMPSESWTYQVSHFRQSYRIVEYDRRGYGRSTMGTRHYSETKDLHSLCRALQITNAVLVGSSSGAAVAIDFTLQNPTLVQRLVLAGPVVGGLAFSEYFENRNRARFAPLSEQGNVEATISNWVADPFLLAPRPAAAREFFQSVMLRNPQNLSRAWDLAEVPEKPAVRYLNEISVPTLIVVGESDIADVHAHAGAIQAGIPGSQRIVVPDCAHLVHLERPDEFNGIVNRFLRGSGRPSDLLYRVPGMNSVLVRSNLTYRFVAGMELHADIYSPPETSAKKLPALVFILGDASPPVLRNAKNWPFMESYGRLAAALGCRGVTFNHRSSQNFQQLDEVRSDIEALLKFLTRDADKLGIDVSRIALWFFSGSGVHMELGMGSAAARTVRCIVAFYPLLAPYPGTVTDEVRTRFSTLDQIKRNSPAVPPLYIAMGRRDNPYLNGLITGLVSSLPPNDTNRVHVAIHPTGEHAFDLRNDDDRTRLIIKDALEFVSRHLR